MVSISRGTILYFISIIFLILFKYFKKYLVHILIFGFFVSIGLAEWGSKNYPTFNFYILPTRGWELLAGSILAYYEITLGHRNKNKKIIFDITFSWISFNHTFNIFFSDFQVVTPDTKLKEEIFHPSLYTLSPIVGVCLIIWYSDNNELITKILSSKFFVGTGLISYSLYLWHFPIFAFARITNFIEQEDILIKLLLGLITVLLSILSYIFIEKPFRNKSYRFSSIIKFLIFLILLIFTINSASIFKKGFEKRGHFPEIIVNTYKTLGYRSSFQNNIACHSRIGEKMVFVYSTS